MIQISTIEYAECEASYPELLATVEEIAPGLTEHEVRDLLQIRGEPILRHSVRQHRAMPQYHVGHAEIVATFERIWPGFPPWQWPAMGCAG